MSKEYYADLPIETKEEDCFHREPVIKKLVDTLKQFKRGENYVIGLYGGWGFGKTSIINMVKASISTEKTISLLYIDAWEFSNNISAVYIEIAGQVLQDNKSKGCRMSSKLSSLLSKTNSTVPDIAISGIGTSSGKIIDALKNVLDRRTISNAIRTASGQTKKIVICIDNIDRLKGEDIIQLFELVDRMRRECGLNFLLPFDKEHVCKVLSSALLDTLNGEDYINKVIQIPIDLPIILREDIDDYFIERLESIMKDYELEMRDDEWGRFATLYSFYGLSKYILTPRDAVRMANALRFSLCNVKGRLNIVDCISIETIRVFDKKLYDRIYKNKKLILKAGLFDGSDASIVGLGDEDKKKRILDLCKISSIGADIIRELFPYVREILSGTSGTDDEDSLRKDKRIASVDYFDAYFATSVGRSQIDDADISEIVAHSSSRDELDDLVLKINATNYRSAFRKLEDYKNEIINKEAFSTALLDLIDNYGYVDKSSFIISLAGSAVFFIDHLLKDEDNKLDIYKKLLEYNLERERIGSIPILIRQAIFYSDPERAHGRPNLNSDELEEYKEFALCIIRKMAKKGMIPCDEIDYSATLYSFWAELGEKAEIDKYVKEHVKNADEAIDFMTQFLGIWSGVDSNIKHRSDFDSATLKTIDKYVDAEYLYKLIMGDKKYSSINPEKVRSLEEPFNEETRELGQVGNEHTDKFRRVVAEQFVYQYERAKKEKIVKAK